jgi:hypothetical protein
LRPRAARYWRSFYHIALAALRKSLKVAKYSLVKVQSACEPPRLFMFTWGSQICYAISVPSRSRLTFAPTCSTRLRHSSPR